MDSISPKSDLHVPINYEWSHHYTAALSKAASSQRLPDMGTVNGLLKKGVIFHVNGAEPVEMDVLIGDQGGSCAFFLLIEKEGNVYSQGDRSIPEYPFFQVGDGDAPHLSGSQDYPPYSATPESWQVVTP